MRVTTQQVIGFKQRGERFAVLTAYDYSTAKLLDEAGIPVLLVGDSLGVVMLGYENTLQVTMEDMLRHTQAVVRGTQRALVVGDMPFLSYQVSTEEAIRNAGRMIQQGGAQAVKLEGGQTVAPLIRRLVDVGIPVMAHIGLTPQSVHALGGHKVQGRTADVAARLLADAAAVEDAGAFSVVLEGVPSQLAGRISQRLRIPTIGIGAGPECDAQVQVINDLLGLFTDFVPRHVRQFAQAGLLVKQAAADYAAAVSNGSFPTGKESFSMDEAVLRDAEAAVPAPVRVPQTPTPADVPPPPAPPAPATAKARSVYAPIEAAV